MSLNLEQEAVNITNELGRVVFVGAFAVNHYSRYRTTRDIDVALASPLNEQKLFELGYTKWEGSRRGSWLTPRGVKVDFYTRDVGGVPVVWILKKAVLVSIGKKSIRVICLEGLILAKHRAGRTADVADLKQLLTQCGGAIRWDAMGEIADSHEITELRQISTALSR